MISWEFIFIGNYSVDKNLPEQAVCISVFLVVVCELLLEKRLQKNKDTALEYPDNHLRSKYRSVKRPASEQGSKQIFFHAAVCQRLVGRFPDFLSV